MVHKEAVEILLLHWQPRASQTTCLVRTGAMVSSSLWLLLHALTPDERGSPTGFQAKTQELDYSCK